MGRMFWQTNDIWQGASWAAVDYTGRYKMVQYFAKQFYSPVLVSPFGTAVHGKFETYVVNDNAFAADALAGDIVFNMQSWSDGLVGSWTEQYTAAPGSATSVFNCTWQAMLARGNCPDGTKCFLTVDVYAGSSSTAGAQPVASNYLLLSPFLDVTTMADPQLKVTNVALAPDAGAVDGEVPFEVTITSVASAAFVWIETQFAGRWSDNGMLMVAKKHGSASAGGDGGGGVGSTGATRTLTFYSDSTVNGRLTAQALKETLQRPTWFPMSTKGGLWSLVDTSPEYTAS